MTLEEAIRHCDEIAEEKCDACGAEHKQLAEWLRELKWRRDEMNDFTETMKDKAESWLEAYNEQEG